MNIFNQIKWTAGLMCSSILLGLHQPDTSKGLRRFSGKVVSAETNKPIPLAFVYIIHGEEEALTNHSGEFSIETSQEFPMKVYAEREGYKKFEIVLTNYPCKPLLRLNSR